MKNGVIELVSVIISDGNEDKTEYTAPCRFAADERGVTALYTEPAQNEWSEINCAVSINGAEATVERRGGIKMKMVIGRGKAHPAVYMTEFGELFLETVGRKTDFELTDGGAVVTLEYELWADGNIISSNKLTLNIREV